MHYHDPYQALIGISHALVAEGPIAVAGLQVESNYLGQHLLGSRDNELTKQ